MKRKIVVTLLLIVMLVPSFLTIAACDKEEEDGKIHLVFYHTMGKNLQTVLNKHIAKFEAMYPDYKIDSKQVGGYDDVRDQISKEIMVGKQPHIAYCYPDHVALYNVSGAVQTLDTFIDSTETVTHADGSTEIVGLTAEQKADFIQGYYEEGKQFGDGLMYTMPFSKSTELMYYNKDFFDKYSDRIEVPTHWWCTNSCPADCKSSMEHVCEEIMKIDSTLIPLAYDSESNWFITMCEQLKSPYTSATSEDKAGHFLFDNDENRSFIRRFTDWYGKGYVTSKELNGGSYTSDLFKKGKTIMCIGSSAGASYQAPQEGISPFTETGITSIPQADPSNPKVISQGPSVCIFKKANTEEVKMSWLFVKYLTTSAEFQADFSLASGYVPVIKSAWEDPVYKEEIAKANGKTGLPQLATVVALEQENAYYASPAFYGSSKARDEVGYLVQTCFASCATYYSGGVTAEESARIDAIIADAFAKAKSRCVSSLS